jgi:hypothetical protein
VEYFDDLCEDDKQKNPISCKDNYQLEEEQICYSKKLHWGYTIKIPSPYSIDGSFDLYGYCTKISLVVLPLDVPNLCVLQGIVLLRKHAHKSYTYIPRPHQRGNWKQTYLLYHMSDILITFYVIISKLCKLAALKYYHYTAHIITT